MTVESQFITLPVKEMLESYQSSLKLIMDSVKTKVKELRRQVQEIKESVSFMSGKYDDVKMKFDVTESKIKAAFIQIEGMNKDINENLDEIKDKQEYLENHSRRNNLKLLFIYFILFQILKTYIHAALHARWVLRCLKTAKYLQIN